jgi:hypothetical protein
MAFQRARSRLGLARRDHCPLQCPRLPHYSAWSGLTRATRLQSYTKYSLRPDRFSAGVLYPSYRNPQPFHPVSKFTRLSAWNPSQTMARVWPVRATTLAPGKHLSGLAIRGGAFFAGLTKELQLYATVGRWFLRPAQGPSTTKPSSFPAVGGPTFWSDSCSPRPLRGY